MSKRPSLAESMKAVSLPIRQDREMPLAESVNQKQFKARTREGMKRLTAIVSPIEHRNVKRLSVDSDRSIEDLMKEAIADLLAKYNK